MGEDERTLYCGNLSDKVTEDVLYELFLQGGPVQKISIPKDRDGRQRTYGFVTYKHVNSVRYALRLFEGTMLYNRPLSMKLRNGAESQRAENSMDSVRHVNQMMLLNQQILGNLPPGINDVMGFSFGTNILQNVSPYPYQLDANDDRNPRRLHPYQRDRDRNRERDRVRDRDRDRDRDRNRDRERNRERNHNDHYREERSHYNRDNNYRSNDYPRHDSRKRWTYH